jgi:hypothetical protein
MISSLWLTRGPMLCVAALLRKRDELAPFHCPVPPVLQTERIAHLSYGRSLLRCGISIPAMTAVGQTRSFGDTYAMSGLPES